MAYTTANPTTQLKKYELRYPYLPVLAEVNILLD